jgi:hypothetical protein
MRDSPESASKLRRCKGQIEAAMQQGLGIGQRYRHHLIEEMHADLFGLFARRAIKPAGAATDGMESSVCGMFLMSLVLNAGYVKKYAGLT